MKILEARDGFVKVESEVNVSLSSFLQIDNMQKHYIAQVIQTKPVEDKYVIYAKILFLYDGTLNNYDKTLPEKNARVVDFSFDILNKTLNYKTPIIAGKFIDDEIDIPVDKDWFDKKMLMSIDSPQKAELIISNCSKQLIQLNKVFVLDMQGDYPAEKFVAGVDFKLPINSETLSFIYEDCLSDATAESQALIKEIFKDLAEYAETVPFVPFAALKSIVDEMVDKSHVFKLLVLKNRLGKLDKLGYFANEAAEAEKIYKILESKTAVIDFSKLDSVFQNRYVAAVYSILNGLENESQVFFRASNVVNKKTLKTVMTSNKVAAVLVVNSCFKYLNEMKQIFSNFIIEPSSRNNEIFKRYSIFLNSMMEDTYLIVGEFTNHIPVVSLTKEFELVPSLTIEHLVSELEPEVIQDIVSAAEEKPEASAEIEKIEEVVSEESESDGFEPEEVSQEEFEEEVEEAAVEEEPVESYYVPEEEPMDESIAAITKKSDDLIERVAEDVQVEEVSVLDNLFSEEEDSIELKDYVAEPEQEQVEESIKLLESTVEHAESVGEVETIEPIETAEQIEEEIISQEIEEMEETSKGQEEQEELSISEDTIVEQEIQLETPLEEQALDVIDVVEESTSLEIEEEAISDNEELVLESFEEPELSASEFMTEESNSIKEDDDFHTQVDEVQTVEIPDEISIIDETEIKLLDDVDFSNDEENDGFEEYSDEDSLKDSDTELDSEEISLRDYDEQTDNVEEAFSQEVLPISDYDEKELEEIVELDESEISEDDILVDFGDDVEETLLNEDALDREIAEDVDRVFTTMKEDSISDSDLDFIDELNGEEENSIDGLEELESVEELPISTSGEADEEDGFLEPLEEVSDSILVEEERDEEKEILQTKEASTPIVPVYGAEIPQEDMVVSDPIEQGDTVIHAKYGTGVVEKMIKYGTKTLFSINFDNVGRRLLDPTLTEIKKS